MSNLMAKKTTNKICLTICNSECLKDAIVIPPHRAPLGSGGYPFILTAFRTGLRLGELLGLACGVLRRARLTARIRRSCLTQTDTRSRWSPRTWRTQVLVRSEDDKRPPGEITAAARHKEETRTQADPHVVVLTTACSAERNTWVDPQAPTR